VQLYYRDAISVEVLQAGQLRIADEQAQVERWQNQAVAQVDDVMQALEDALSLLCQPGAAYEQADPSLRKMLNRAIFFRILIQVVDREIEVEGIPHDVFTQLVQTAKSLGMPPERPPDILMEAYQAVQGGTRTGTRRARRFGPQRTNPSSSFWGRGSHVERMAEREGFEPSVDVEAHTRFPVVPVQPLRHLSRSVQASGHRAPRARPQICQMPPRSTGTRSPAEVRPVTSTSDDPIMKSMWICERLMRPWSSSPALNS
jgi:hypothetical protein